MLHDAFLLHIRRMLAIVRKELLVLFCNPVSRMLLIVPLAGEPRIHPFGRSSFSAGPPPWKCAMWTWPCSTMTKAP